MPDRPCPECGQVHVPDPKRVSPDDLFRVFDEVDAAIAAAPRVDAPSARYLDYLSQFTSRLRGAVRKDWPPEQPVHDALVSLLVSFSRDPLSGELECRLDKLSRYMSLAREAK